MSILGLHLGVSFAELSLIDSHTYEPIAHQRVYLPRLSLKNALQKFVQKNPGHSIEKIFLASNHVEKLAPFRLGGSTAHLVTDGWENTGWLSQRLDKSLSRPPAVQSQDLIFAAKERVSSSGQIICPLDTEYVQQIAAKLKMMEVKRVCVHFLNSKKNPLHAEQATAIMKEQGFEVYNLQLDSDLDIEKSRRLSLSAAMAGTWEDIKTELTAETESPPVFVLTSEGFKELSSATDSLENLSGLDYLWDHFRSQNIVYLGLENFFQVFPQKKKTLWNSPWGTIYRPHSEKRVLGTQPSSPIQLNFWNELDFEATAESFEPGPMSFGRGQKLMAFDLYFDEMSKQPELNDWLAANASNKINSNLTALSKSSKDNKTANEVISYLKEHFRKRILLEIGTKGESVFVGLWAKILKPSENYLDRPLSECIARLGMGQPL